MALNILGGGSLVSVEKNVEILPLPNNGFIKFDLRYSTILRPKASWEKAMLKMEVGGLMGLDFLGGTKHFHWCVFFSKSQFRNRLVLGSLRLWFFYPRARGPWFRVKTSLKTATVVVQQEMVTNVVKGI